MDETWPAKMESISLTGLFIPPLPDMAGWFPTNTGPRSTQPNGNYGKILQ
jgi:hypothetical protein